MSDDREVKRRQAELERRVQTDPEFYSAMVLKIQTKAAELLPFRWNPVQRYVYSRLWEQRRTQGYVRALILKGRQMGISTLINALGYGETSRKENRRAIVIAHEDKASRQLFRMIQNFYAHDEMFHPQAVKNNAGEIEWNTPAGTGLNSRYEVRTVGKEAKGGQGRGSTFQFFHGSELAFWGNAGGTTMGAVKEAIPNEYPAIEGTSIIQETTANGYDLLFYPSWEEITADRAHGIPNDYMQIFLPWFWHAPYSTRLDDEGRKYIMATLTDYERWLMRQRDMNGKYVDTGQIAWRRWKIKNGEPPPGLSKDQFYKQEYPATPTEAWQATGSHIFDLEQVTMLMSEAPDPAVRYEFIEGSGEPVYRPDGRLRVWKEPEPMRSYVIGADVAEGLPHGDYSCAYVIDHHTGEVVACWHGHCHPETFGDILAHLGQRYNTAWLVPERNNHGQTTVTRLLNLRYPRLYAEQAVETPGAKPRKRYGWHTKPHGSGNKGQMVDKLTKLMDPESGDPLSIKDKECYREMLRFEKHEDLSYGAQEGFNDDRLMALSIAHMAKDRLPTPKQQAVQARTERRGAEAPQPAAKQTAHRRWKATT